MLVTELKKMLELDEQINQLHSELSGLYAERLAIGAEGTPETKQGRRGKTPSAKASRNEPKNWAQGQYDKLQSAWRCYGIELPAFDKLQTKLEKSYKIINELQNAEPKLANSLEIVVMPPGNVLPFPITNELRYCQGFSDGQDYVNQAVKPPATARNWRVLVTYAGETGLSYGLPQTIIDTKSYQIGGYDTRGLGPAEYAALSLQYQQPIDDGTWTLLLKNHRADTPVVSAGFHAGRFRFDIDEANGGLDIDLYRPVVEVTV